MMLTLWRSYGYEVVSINVLTGTNCIKALEPIDFIASENGSPYAMETGLGWYVVRPIGRHCKGDDVISCNRIAVQNAGTR